MLIFVVPVRHHQSIADWQPVRELLAQTLASIAGQTGGAFACRVVANRGTELPVLPAGVGIVRVDLPVPRLPQITDDREGYYNEVRRDRGLRVLAGIGNVRSHDHVMVVDYDDLVSRDIASFVAEHPEAPGFYVDAGYLYSGGHWVYETAALHKRCGSTLIVRRDLLGEFETAEGIDLDAVRRRLGSHVFIKDELAAQGTPLAPLPFRGAAYRIGQAHATSGSRSVFQMETPWRAVVKRPSTYLPRLARYRRFTGARRAEFLPAA